MHVISTHKNQSILTISVTQTRADDFVAQTSRRTALLGNSGNKRRLVPATCKRRRQIKAAVASALLSVLV